MVSRLGTEVYNDILFLMGRVDIGRRGRGRCQYLITDWIVPVGIVSQAYKLASSMTRGRQ